MKCGQTVTEVQTDTPRAQNLATKWGDRGSTVVSSPGPVLATPYARLTVFLKSVLAAKVDALCPLHRATFHAMAGTTQ